MILSNCSQTQWKSYRMSLFPLKSSVDSCFQSLSFLLSLMIFYPAEVHFHNFLKNEIIRNIKKRSILAKHMNLGKLLYLLKLQAFQIHFTDRQMPDRKTDNKTNDRYIYIYIYIHTHIHTHTYILGLL